jgi:tRNA threonylcarbamoyladenosine biosynthesis protein TsaE
MTHAAGASLAQSLYRIPVTILLTGPLGAGKTTFLQGLGEGLGIGQRLTSPTYALEQRYRTEHFGELLHIDLYRLTQHDAGQLIHSSERHHGIRCIEWADRLTVQPDGEAPPAHAGGFSDNRLRRSLAEPAEAAAEQSTHSSVGLQRRLPAKAGETIAIALTERPDGAGRDLRVAFQDIALPTLSQVDAWRQELFLPHIIARHCDMVAQTAVRFGEELQKRGIIVRLATLRAAGAVHDLLRFVDFHRGAAHIERQINPAHARKWAEVKAEYAGLHHEAAAAKFLTGKGFPELAEIVRVHGLTLADATRVTTEQRLLYYADKRVKLDDVVSLEERLRDFTARYSHQGRLRESDAWYDEARKTEHALFPDGPPF